MSLQRGPIVLRNGRDNLLLSRLHLSHLIGQSFRTGSRGEPSSSSSSARSTVQGILKAVASIECKAIVSSQPGGGPQNRIVSLNIVTRVTTGAAISTLVTVAIEVLASGIVFSNRSHLFAQLSDCWVAGKMFFSQIRPAPEMKRTKM